MDSTSWARQVGLDKLGLMGWARLVGLDGAEVGSAKQIQLNSSEMAAR